MSSGIALLMGLFALTAAGTAGQTVEVFRDPWGIPHIFADWEEGGFFGLGYACAEDRLLQMELIRRKGAGRLAEVFGPQCLDADRQARIAGHAAYAPQTLARLPDRWQRALRCYAAGVNLWIKQHPDDVARRFKPLGVAPEAWTPADCLVAARGILSLGSPFNEAAVQDYHRFRELMAQAGEAAAARPAGMVIDDAGAVVPESEMAKDKEVYARLKAMPRMPGFDLRSAPAEPRKMSHAWAVSGRRSTTGKPILENDPQLPLSSPPFFYEFHLAAGSIDARGLGIPGCPGLFIGFNRRIAWGGSALGVDSIVTFLDRLTADGKGFVFEGKAVPFARRLEKIEVKGGQTVIQEVLMSRHGTVFNALVRQPRPGEAYLCYDAQTMDAGTSVRMMLEAMGAGNWAEFRQALAYYYYPGLHIVYADADGNLGYQTAVHRPFTAQSPRRALEGWTGRDEVRSRIPLDKLPHMLNPDTGYISHANNLPVGSWYPYDLGLATGGTGDTGRSLRLRQLLEGDRKFSVEDFERVLHRDDVDPLIAALLPVARRVAEEDKVSDPSVLRLLKSLDGWDMHAATTDRFPAARGLENTLTPYRGAGLQNVYGAGGGGVAHLARDIASQFAHDGPTPKDPAVRAYLINWLRSATGTGGRGGASDEWTGRMSAGRPAERRAAERRITIPYQKTIPHDLPVVDSSLDIVSPPLACLNQDTIWSQPGNLYTQIVDLSDVDNSRSMIAPGNAEDPAGRFRTNQIDLWVKGTTHPAPLSRAKVEALGGACTKLVPTAYSGPEASPGLTVDKADPAWRFVAAIPASTPEPRDAPRPRPPSARKPDDPKLESAFRRILRRDTPTEEIDVLIARCREYAKGNRRLTEQLRSAAVLGRWLIEEAASGRLKIPYGSPHALKRLQELLKDLGEGDARNPPPAPIASSVAISSRVKVGIAASSTNVVRLRGRSFWDDSGPLLGLGVSYFQALRHAKHDRERLNRNLALLASKGFNYVRVLSMVSWDGLEIAPVTFKNRVGRVVAAWPDYWQQFRNVLELAGRHGLRVEVTVFADAQYIMPNASARQAHLDGILANISGREHHVLHLEVANEAWQNGFFGAQGIAQLREFAKYLADRTDVLVAITSNDDTSEKSIVALYRGSAADLATVHFSRDTHTSEGGWLPVRDPYRAGNLPGVPPVSSNEPIGPGSSVNSESDPMKLCAAAVFAFLANLPAYVYHSRAGVYGFARCCPPGGGEERFENSAGIDAYRFIRKVLPPDLSSWTRNDGLEPGAPLTVFCSNQPNRYWPETTRPSDGCVRNIGSVKGTQFVCFPMGILGGGVTLEARHPVRFQVVHPLTGEVFSNVTLKAGQRYTVPQGAGAYICKGTFLEN